AKLIHPWAAGGRKAIFIAGAKPKTGETTYTDPYYDEIAETNVADNRGSFGISDCELIGGQLYGPEHHSNRRLADPLSPLNWANEPDTLPACLYIDGLAGNSSGKLQGIR